MPALPHRGVDMADAERAGVIRPKLAMALCLATSAGCLRANFSGQRFGPWIVAVAASFCLYLWARVGSA